MEKIELNYTTIELMKNAVVITASKNFIPKDSFKETFNKVLEVVKENKVNKIVFDKRNMIVFDQSSMEWYYNEWKAKIFDLGITEHRKLMPDNKLFNTSVKIGKEKILEKNPEGKFTKTNIKYCDSLEEALKD